MELQGQALALAQEQQQVQLTALATAAASASCRFQQPHSCRFQAVSSNSSKAGRPGRQRFSAAGLGSHPAAAAEMRLRITGSNSSSSPSYLSAASLQEM
jgi:hypothetical protein